MQEISPREIEVAKLIDRGMTYDEIGKELGISPRTAKAITDRLRLKINVQKKRHIPGVLKELGVLDK